MLAGERDGGGRPRAMVPPGVITSGPSSRMPRMLSAWMDVMLLPAASAFERLVDALKPGSSWFRIEASVLCMLGGMLGEAGTGRLVGVAGRDRMRRARHAKRQAHLTMCLECGACHGFHMQRAARGFCLSLFARLQIARLQGGTAWLPKRCPVPSHRP